MTEMAQPASRDDFRKLVPLAYRAIAAVIITFCAISLFHAFQNLTFADVIRSAENTADKTLLLAFSLIALNFCVMTAMEVLALRDAGVDVALRRAAVSAFLANALSLAAGLGPLSGASVRATLFRKWRLPAGAAAITALSSTVMSLSGGAILAALGLTLSPASAAALFHLPATLAQGIGAVVLIVAAILVILAGRRRSALRVFGAMLILPSGFGALFRLGLGSLDWFISSCVLFTFLRGDFPAPLSFITSFATAHFAGMAAGVPAGLGVFDALILNARVVTVPAAQVAAALLLYRLCAYFIPAAIATVGYVAFASRTDA